MIKTIKKAKLSKRTNRKQNLKKFIDSGYTDKQAFLNACKNDENLLIYTCLTSSELDEIIQEMKKYETLQEQIDFLVQNQPFMNENVERFNRCCESIINYLKGYIEYNGYRMANGSGSYEDWSSEFYLKFVKICNFYRTRWFYPEKLEKPTSVVFNPMKYCEFVYILRMSLSGERKHRAFLATQDNEASIFKLSLDAKIEDTNGDKVLGDLIPDNGQNVNETFEKANLNNIFEKALKLCDEYPDAVKCKDKIADFYDKQDPIGFDKKTLILAKIFLYKAGLVSPKVLAFIKALSPTYKMRYQISAARVGVQIQEQKKIKKGKSIKKVKNEDLTYKELILRKRGEL